MMHRDMGSGYNVRLISRLLPDSENPFRISRLPFPQSPNRQTWTVS